MVIEAVHVSFGSPDCGVYTERKVKTTLSYEDDPAETSQTSKTYPSTSPLAVFQLHLVPYYCHSRRTCKLFLGRSSWTKHCQTIHVSACCSDPLASRLVSSISHRISSLMWQLSLTWVLDVFTVMARCCVPQQSHISLGRYQQNLYRFCL